MNDVKLFRTHFWNDLAQKHFRQLKEQSNRCEMIFDSSGGRAIPEVPNVFSFTLDDYKKSGYPLATHQQILNLPAYKQLEAIYEHKAYSMLNWEIYFNPEYAVLLYFKEHPEYDFYWSIEYDVCFNGNWNVLFQSTEQDKSDILSTYTRAWENDLPFDSIWNTLNFDVPQDDRKIMFGPIVRYSNKALETIDKELKSGKHGFYEVFGTTVCNLAGLSINEIGKYGKFYDYLTFNGGLTKEIWTNEFIQEHKNYMFHPMR